MFFDVVRAEILQSWKALLRKPGYLSLAGGTLTLGVAACVTVFSLAEASLMTPIAVPDIEEVVVIGPLEDQGRAGGMSPIQYNNLGELPGVESIGVGAPAESTVAVLNQGQALMLKSWSVSDGFLKALGLPFSVGRGFNSDESRPNGLSAAIISHSFWQDSFAGSPEVLERSIQVGGRSIPIVGVLPADFPYQSPQILLPLAWDPTDSSWSGSYKVVARLQTGATRESISKVVTERMRRLEQEHNMDRIERTRPYTLQPIEEVFRAGTGGSEDIMLLFAACAAVLLLVVLVNLSNLSLLRIVARSHDSAVRRALGAPLYRVLLPTAGEQFLIALIGCFFGLLVAWIALKLADSVIPAEWFVSAESRPKIGLVSYFFAFFIAVFVAAVALLISALRARFASMTDSLVGGGRAGGERKSGILGKTLVCMQATLATVLLLMAALSAKTLWAVSQIEYGFEAEHALAFHITPDRQAYEDQQAVLTMADTMVANLESIPGVARVGYGTNIPASGTNHNDTAPYIMSDGRVLESITSYLISPGYLEAFSIPLRRGKGLDSSFSANADSILITEELENVVAEGSLVGRSLALPYNSVNPEWEDLPLRVRGVSAGVRAYGPQREMPPIVWIPFMDNTEKLYNLWRDSDSMFFVVKTGGNPAAYLNQVRSVAKKVDPTLPIAGLKTLREYQAEHLSVQSLNLALILVFAALALGLTSTGTYSVMAVNVASKKHEFGIRAALGAQSHILLRDVVLSGGKPLLIGLIIGLGVAYFASSLIESYLFGVSAADPVTVIAIVCILLASGVLACLAPGIRAARIRPMQALRVE